MGAPSCAAIVVDDSHGGVVSLQVEELGIGLQIAMTVLGLVSAIHTVR